MAEEDNNNVENRGSLIGAELDFKSTYGAFDYPDVPVMVSFPEVLRRS